MLGLEVDEGGATLIDVILAVERDQSLVPALLDRVDPDGAVTAAMTMPDDVTSLAREVGRTPGFDEVAACLRAGFATRFGLDVLAEEAPPVPVDDDTDFLRARAARRRPSIGERARRPCSACWRRTVRVPPTDRSLPCAWRGICWRPRAPSSGWRPRYAAVGSTARRSRQWSIDVVRPPRDFILGVGPLRTIAETIVRAAS